MMTTSGNAQGVHGNVLSPAPPTINVSLAGFLVLFVASRLLYLMLIDPSYVSPQFGDELYVGTIAQELVTGLSMPFTEYRATNYMLGTLVMGALASGFFWLFGPTLFALKLASLLVPTLALAFWYWTIQRAAGERVAGYFALLFCLSPPLFTAYSVASLGDHSNSILFSAATVFLFFRMLSEEKPSLAYHVLLGLIAGDGLWFCYTYALTLLALLAFWLSHDRGRFWRPRVLWFALGFVVGFSPWILINVQTHFAGLVIHGTSVWEHFGLSYLWENLSHPRKLAPYQFFADLASDDPQDLPRRAVNLLYSLLYLAPILTTGVLYLKTGRSEPVGPSSTQPTLVGFGILYLVVFTLAVQFSNFKAQRYHLPAYPFLFFFVAHSLVRYQDLLPRVQRQIQTVFIASVVLLGLGTHAPLFSLDRPGYVLSTKGYTYASLPGTYLSTHALAGSDNPKFILEVVQRPFLSDIFPKLSVDDQRELSLALEWMLVGAVSLNGQAEEDFPRIERLVPPGFDKHFYYELGATAMIRHPHELPQAVAAVEFVRHRSSTAHYLALVGIYWQWPQLAALDSSPEELATSSAPHAAELAPHYWRALGYLAGRYWFETDPPLRLLNAHLQSFVPQFDPSVQRAFLQGIGKLLFVRHISDNHRVAPADLERFPSAYQEGLLEGWGMALGERDLFSPFPWKDQESPDWMAAVKGFSARSLASIRQGREQFDALFKGPASRVLEHPRSR